MAGTDEQQEQLKGRLRACGNPDARSTPFLARVARAALEEAGARSRGDVLNTFLVVVEHYWHQTAGPLLIQSSAEFGDVKDLWPEVKSFTGVDLVRLEEILVWRLLHPSARSGLLSLGREPGLNHDSAVAADLLKRLSQSYDA